MFQRLSISFKIGHKQSSKIKVPNVKKTYLKCKNYEKKKTIKILQNQFIYLLILPTTEVKRLGLLTPDF